MVIKHKGETYDLSLDRQSVGVSHKAEGEDLASPDPGLEMTPVFLDLDFRPLPRRNAELAIDSQKHGRRGHRSTVPSADTIKDSDSRPVRRR